MLIDSEEPIADLEATWRILANTSSEKSPRALKDEQVLLMVTCMETLIVADRAALNEHYGDDLQQSALPPLTNLEDRDRHDVQERLAHATRNCANAYTKGKRSFAILGKLDPATLQAHLPSFVRVRRVLESEL